MSMTTEHAEASKNEFAIVCCRTEAGTIIKAENLEDPDIFPDMVDSGLLTIPDNCLKVGEVIGAKLTKTIDSLSPITPDIAEGAKTIEAEVKKESTVPVVTEASEEIKEPAVDTVVTCEGGILRIRIEEGKGIDIELPL